MKTINLTEANEKIKEALKFRDDHVSKYALLRIQELEQLALYNVIDSLPSKKDIALKIGKKTSEIGAFKGLSQKETNLRRNCLVQGALWMKEELKVYCL